MNGNKKKELAQAIAATLVMALAVFATLNQTLPPQALPASTAATDFSAALGLVFALAIRPMPLIRTKGDTYAHALDHSGCRRRSHPGAAGNRAHTAVVGKGVGRQ